MRTIKVLDCTLRDGGYVNNWNFGKEVVKSVVDKLKEANLDIIECGYLSRTKKSTPDQSIYGSIEDINANFENLPLACMINLGEFTLEDLPVYNQKGVNTLRIVFTRKQITEALEYCKGVKEKGYYVFVQPMVTADYSDEELDLLIKETNKIRPEAIYMVDSFGTMRKKDLIQLFQRLDSEILPETSIGFHSHNNLQLSFYNAQEFIEYPSSRNIIVDSSVFGMGRGAGNLCTELLTLYMNENYQGNYQLIPILEIMDQYINPIFMKTPWGYSVPYYIAASSNCHPNYASYLVNKQTLGVKDINSIILRIPQDKKQRYDKVLIEQLYLKHQENLVDDKESVDKIKRLITDRSIVILAPGKSVKNHFGDINTYIKANNALIWSLNFIPEEFQPDILFLNNMKRFTSLSDVQNKVNTVVITSNIQQHTDNFLKINYESYINPDYDEMDNAGIMLLRFLKSLGVVEVAIAGYDGFQVNPRENYYSDELMKNTAAELISNRNSSIKAQLLEIMKSMRVKFLTPTLYLPE